MPHVQHDIVFPHLANQIIVFRSCRCMPLPLPSPLPLPLPSLLPKLSDIIERRIRIILLLFLFHSVRNWRNTKCATRTLPWTATMIFWIHTQTWPCPWVVSLTLNRRCISSLEWSVVSLMVPSIPQAFQIRSSICSSANQSFSLRPRHAQWCFTQSLRWRCKTQAPLWWCPTCASKLSRNKSRTRI